MQIDGVSALKFEDTALVWKNKTLRYNDIASVGWQATITQNSINGIHTGKDYSASLTIYTSDNSAIAITGDPGWTGSLKKRGFEGLARAAEVIAEMTFVHRIGRIEQRLKERRFFGYGKLQFHQTGDVFENGLFAFNILTPSTRLMLNIFEMTIIFERTEKKFFGLLQNRSLKLSLERDRDCFLYMLKSIYGITFANERIREKRYPTRETFYETVVRFGALLAATDGRVDSAELRKLKEFFGLSSESFPEASQLYNSQLHSPMPAAEILTPFAACFEDADELKETFLFGMASVVMADGVAHPKEVELLHEAVRILGIASAEARRIFEAAGIGFSGKNDEGGGRSSTAPLNRSKAFAILGVPDTASEEEIKFAYRALVRRYHPDVLRSQNLPEAELQRAELLMRRINEAYGWLKTSD